MTGRHTAKSGGPTPASRLDRKAQEAWAAATIWPPVPAAVAAHVHDFDIVAEFEGIRAAIEECRGCGATHTIWRSEVGR